MGEYITDTKEYSYNVYNSSCPMPTLLSSLKTVVIMLSKQAVFWVLSRAHGQITFKDCLSFFEIILTPVVS